jgi:flavorubredoxin
MEARVDEIADRVYRISTLVDDVAPGGFSFNQFLIDAPEPVLFHTGMRGLFPLVRAGIERVMPVDRLRWISFAHVEADECGAMNEFLALAPQAQVAHSGLGCMVSVNDLADRPPRPLGDGEVLELGDGPTGQRLLEIATPHVPHNWESHLLFEQQSATLLAGDLFTQLGDGPAITDGDIIENSIQAEELFRSTSLGPAVPATLRRLAELEPRTLAVMHGSSFHGDGAALLRTLADVYEQRFECGSPSAMTAG